MQEPVREPIVQKLQPRKSDFVEITRDLVCSVDNMANIPRIGCGKICVGSALATSLQRCSADNGGPAQAASGRQNLYLSPSRGSDGPVRANHQQQAHGHLYCRSECKLSVTGPVFFTRAVTPCLGRGTSETLQTRVRFLPACRGRRSHRKGNHGISAATAASGIRR